MHIIFNNDLISEINEKYILLELDTVLYNGLDHPLKMFAVIDDVEIPENTDISSLLEQHTALLVEYKNSKWDNAILNANALRGSWNGYVDQFYESVVNTATKYKENNKIWDGIVNSNDILIEYPNSSSDTVDTTR